MISKIKQYWEKKKKKGNESAQFIDRHDLDGYSFIQNNYVNKNWHETHGNVHIKRKEKNALVRFRRVCVCVCVCVYTCILLSIFICLFLYIFKSCLPYSGVVCWWDFLNYILKWNFKIIHRRPSESESVRLSVVSGSLRHKCILASDNMLLGDNPMVRSLQKASGQLTWRSSVMLIAYDEQCQFGDLWGRKFSFGTRDQAWSLNSFCAAEFY